MSEEIPWPSGHIAILYSDLEQSAQVAGRLHDALYDQQIKQPFYALLLEKITAHRGRVFQDKGDGVIAVFQQTRDAVAMAADFQQAMAQTDLPRVRIGIHTSVNALPLPGMGPHPQRSDIPNYGTEDLSFTSRIEYLAEGGQVLLSETAKVAYVGTGAEPIPLHPWPNRRLLKVDHPETVYELLYPGRTPQEPGARFLPDFYKGERNRYVPRPGKEAEVLQAFYADNFMWRIVAIRGAGGMGKTRLAVTCAVALGGLLTQPIHLVSLADPGLTPQNTTVQQFVNKLGEGLGWPEAERNPEIVLAWAAATECILLLDNCESVASEPVRAFIGDIIKPGKVRILLTSRTIASPQGMTKDVSLNDGMEPDEAEALFVETVQRQATNWQIPAGAPHEAFQRILTLTDAIPLAVELTAAHATTRKLEDIADELAEQPLPALPPDYTYGNEDETYNRHRSLLRCLNWSWRLLSATEQDTLCLCGLFAAPFTLPVMVEVAEKEQSVVLSSLTRLVNASLVRFDTITGRYRLHHSTMQYAKIRLKERTDYITLTARFTEVYLAIIPNDGNLIQPDQILALRDEWNNLCEAHRYTVAVENFEAAMHFQQLYRVATTQSRVAEFIALVEATNTLTQTYAFTKRDDTDSWRANILNTLGISYRNLSSGDRNANLKQAIACYESALRIYSEERFPIDWAATQNNLGNTYSNLLSGNRDANLKQAIACYEAALRVRIEKRFPIDWAATQNNLGNTYSNLLSGNRDVNLKQAIACYEAALRIYTEKYLPIDWAATQNNLGNTYRKLLSDNRDANLKQAIACYEAALRIYTEKRFSMDWAMIQFNMALLENERGESEQAILRMKQVQDLYRKIGAEHNAADAGRVLKAWEEKPNLSPSCAFGILGGLLLFGGAAIWGVVRLVSWWMSR